MRCAFLGNDLPKQPEFLRTFSARRFYWMFLGLTAQAKICQRLAPLHRPYVAPPRVICVNLRPSAVAVFLFPLERPELRGEVSQKRWRFHDLETT